MIDFGWANSWGNKMPELVQQCRVEKAHTPTREKHPQFKSVTKVSCKECNYSYMIDSSD